MVGKQFVHLVLFLSLEKKKLENRLDHFRFRRKDLESKHNSGQVTFILKRLRLQYSVVRPDERKIGQILFEPGENLDEI